MDMWTQVFVHLVYRILLFIKLGNEWPHRPSCCSVCGRLQVRFPAEAAPICTVQVALTGY